MEYRAAAKSAKPSMAVLAGPTRSFAGWAHVRMGKLSRASRRFVILRSSNLYVCSTESARSQQLCVSVSGASMSLTAAKYECLVRADGARIWIQWASESELRVCKSAFEFANRRVEDYYRLVAHRQLGKGRSSEVVFAFDTATGDHAAVKIMNKDKARHTDREFAEKEVLIRMTIQHPCIVQTLDIFESPYDLFVVMELMGGGPLDRRMIKQNAPLSEHEARVIMLRLFAALKHLHSRDIAHRNVKPQNIFLDYSDDMRWPETAKLSDFSLACFLEDPDSSRQVVGTPEYLAPEASIMSRNLHGEREVVFGTEVDMWAAGVTLYNILSLELPFEGEYPPEVFKKARSGKLVFSNRGFGQVSAQAVSLIRSLLNVDRRKRPTSETVLLHPWFQDPVKGNQTEDLLAETTALSLTSHATVMSEELSRFRVAVVAVRFVRRLAVRTPGLHLQGASREEKRFDFNVSGINIAPVKCGAEDDGDDTSGYGSYKHSTTMMSRISTSSTVKTRSSLGGDSGYTGMGFSRTISTDSRPMVTQRTDSKYDYLSRTGSRPTRPPSFGGPDAARVHRMPSDKALPGVGGGGGGAPDAAAEQPKSSWRWRRRSAKPPAGEQA